MLGLAIILAVILVIGLKFNFFIAFVVGIVLFVVFVILDCTVFAAYTTKKEEVGLIEKKNE